MTAKTSKLSRCQHCQKHIENKYFYCSAACHDADFAKEKEHNLWTDGDTKTRGYAGYNLGLDADVKNKGEWSRLAHEQGLIPQDGF